MTAYSYQDWNSLSQDEQSRRPGISIPRSHALNNPNRGVYWSGQSSALALATSIQDTLASDDREEAEKMFRQLKLTHRAAVEAPKAVERAMTARHLDANRALGSSNFSFSDEQAEQMQSAIDDIYRLQTEAEIAGLDPVKVAEYMINGAAAKAVGFGSARNLNPAFAGYLSSKEGRESQANLNQSVRQLYSLVRTGEHDALDHDVVHGIIPEDRTQSDELDFVKSLLGSIPLERNPHPIEPARDFSVRMDTIEEAKVVEQILKWVGDKEQLPEPEMVNEAFNAWRDNGVVASPYSPRSKMRIGVIVGSGHTGAETAMHLINGSPAEAQLIVLTSENNELAALEKIGDRPVINTRAVATRDGVGIEGINAAPAGAVLMMNLPAEHASDPVKRSVAANAFVGSSLSIAHAAGTTLQPFEAQAIHLAGSMRKLTIGVDRNGHQLNPAQLRDLRTKSQDVDKEADADRYYTAGHGRPVQGVMAVAFEGARNYDAAARKYAPGRDPMAEGYSRIPKNAMILTSDNNKMAAYKFLEKNHGDRPVFFAEAERKLSYAHDVFEGLDSQKIMAREAKTELTIYDRPRSARTGAPEEVVEWNDPKLRGAVLLVSGVAMDGAINTGAQTYKVAQEAIADFSHSGMIFDDMQKDFHAAHMTRLALEMGKRFTVVNKEGNVVPLTMARDATRRNAQSFTELTDIEIAKRFHGNLEGLDIEGVDMGRAESGRRNVAYELSHPVGQMTLAHLPGMNEEKAAKLGKLNLSLEEVFMTKDPEVKKALYDAGMPSDTIKALDNRQVWRKAVERALENEAEAGKWGMRYEPAGKSKILPEGRAGFTFGKGTVDKPVVAMIGNALPTHDGWASDPVSPADLVDRKQLVETIQTMTAKGFAIATTFEEGVGLAVIEEASKVKGAEVIVASPSNPWAASPEMRLALAKLMEKESTTLVTPTAIAPVRFEDREGNLHTRYAEQRSAMQDTLANVSDMAIVVQASTSDQTLHMVDKLNAQDKPVTVMLPEDTSLAATEAYRGNIKLGRGGGQTQIESLSLATVPSPQGYANISDEDTEVKLVDGVYRGNAGTFQSARIARSDMARGGHHYKTIGWGQAAPVITSRESAGHVADLYRRGELEPMGPYVGPTQREIEKRAVARHEVNKDTREMFEEQQKRHTAHIMEDAARAVGY